MEKKEILERFNELSEEIITKYNKVRVRDNYNDLDEDFDGNLTNFYLEKQESFDEFKDLWEENLKNKEQDLSYDEILDNFNEVADGKFDYFENGSLDVYTDEIYELEI